LSVRPVVKSRIAVGGDMLLVERNALCYTVYIRS
jgi:hypothetical protein